MPLLASAKAGVPPVVRFGAVRQQQDPCDQGQQVAAGFLTAALYLLAQIASTGKLELPSDNADYSRVVLIVSMAAVFASLYLDAALSRFDDVKQSVMAGTDGKKTDSQ